MTAIKPRCWHCAQPLAKKNGTTNEFWFALIKDQDGVEHKVHKCCVQTCLRLYRRITADWPGNPERLYKVLGEE